MVDEQYDRKSARPGIIPGLGDMLLRQLTMTGEHDHFSGDPSGPRRSIKELVETWQSPGVANAVDTWFHDRGAAEDANQQGSGPEPRQGGPFALPCWIECYLLAQNPGKMPFNAAAVKPLPLERIPDWGLHLPGNHLQACGPMPAHNAEIMEQFPAVAARHPVTARIVSGLVQAGKWPKNWMELSNVDLRADLRRLM